MSCSPKRFSACSIVSLTSFTVAFTAESSMKSLAVTFATSLARLVFPVPGGPQKISDES